MLKTVATKFGDVVGPASATANNLALFDGATGKLIKETTTGTGVVTALGVNTGSAGAFVVNGGALGTPSSGTVTNLTGTASININGTVGATTPTTGAFTTATLSSDLTLNGGTANGVLYLNGSKVATSGSALVFDGTNLGLGVTPSAWPASAKAMQVNARAAFWGDTTQTIVSNNMYASSGGDRYIATATAALYAQNAGQHIWFTAPSGTAGNAITFTQAMTLDASGNLIVGATSASHRLHVERNWNGSTWIITVNTDSGAGAAAGMLFKNNTGELGAISLLSSANSPADSLFLRSLSTNPLAFGTNNTERARITSGGYFKASNSGTYINSTGTYHELVNDAQTSPAAFIRNSNASFTSTVLAVTTGATTTNNSFYFLDCNNGTPQTRLRIADSGDVTNTNGTYGTISDAKMKTDIVDAGSQWADIKAIRFRKFKMKDDPSGLLQLGVVAQELEQTSPGLVDEHVDRDAEGNDLGTTTKSVKTSILLMKAAKALQEAMTRIETLEAKVSALEGN